MPLQNKIDPWLLEQTLNCLNTCIFDEKLSIYYVNENFCSLIGFNKEQLDGKKLSQLSHHHQNKSNHAFMLGTIKKGDTWKGELTLHHKNNYAIYLDATIKPVKKDSNSIHYIASFIDIQNRKQLIDNLKQRAHQQGLIAILGQISLHDIPINDLLEQALSVVCGSFEIDSGAILDISVNGEKALIRTSYNSPDLQAGVTILDIEKNSLLQQTLQTEQPIVCESLNNETTFIVPEIFLQAGYHFAAFSVIGDIKYPFGIFSLLSTTSRKFNIDETHFFQSVCNILAEAINRKNMETALRHEQQLSKKYLDVAEVIFIVIDRQEKILLANRHAAAVLGYSQSELSGMCFFESFTSPKEKDHARNHFYKLLNDEKNNKQNINHYKDASPIINKQNETRYIKWKNSALHDQKGSVNSVLYAGEDVTDLLEYEREQKNLEKQLSQAQKMEAVGMLAGGIAHDFNNILASILGFSDLALEVISKDDIKLHKYLTKIRTSGIKARDIIAQIQSINLQDESQNKAILLPSLLKGTLQMLRSALPSSIEMKLDIKNRIPAAYMNPSKFNQIVMHLLTNARNALKGKGKIFIDLSLMEIDEKTCSACQKNINNKYVVFCIRDNGPGFNSTSTSELFMPSKSSGLSGLSLVSKLVHESNGHIIISKQASTDSPGTDETCVQLLFEIQQSHLSENRSQNISNLDLNKINNKHLMIVDDENSVATYMGELFKGAGFKVSVYGDSVEALNAFKKQPHDYDLIVTDQTMPALTGDLLAASMLKLKPDLPVIICSGHSDLLQKNTAEELNVSALLKKPIDSAELLHIVVSLLSKAST